MSAIVRSCVYPNDFEPIGQFLVRTFRTGEGHRNWLQPRWEYMHYHAALDRSTLGRIGVWEDGGEIVGVAHHEHRLGVAYFDVAPGYSHLKRDMLVYAQAHLAREEEGQHTLEAFIDGTDAGFGAIARATGFVQDRQRGEPMSVLNLDESLPAIRLPEGFRLKSLQEENDLEKVHRVLHRGFDHPGEPPQDELAGRRLMQSAPRFRRDLTIVAQAPNGAFVSYCGLWYEQSNRVAYVEPVATDPDFRRMGLGTAVVLEGVRRCRALGATVAYVGSGAAFYRSMGFRNTYTQYVWSKQW